MIKKKLATKVRALATPLKIFPTYKCTVGNCFKRVVDPDIEMGRRPSKKPPSGYRRGLSYACVDSSSANTTDFGQYDIYFVCLNVWERI